LYAVNDGVYRGEFWVAIDRTETEWVFLTMPVFNSRIVSFKSLIEGLELGIIEPVEKLKPDIIKLCRKQYLAITSKAQLDKK
jgi:hypothetical protein